MIQQVLYALPPLSNLQVVDVMSGSGQVARQVIQAYPKCHMTVIEKE